MKMLKTKPPDKDFTGKYCVYYHTDETGTPFYVGSGRVERAFIFENKEEYFGKSKRGLKYSEKVRELNYDVYVEIVGIFDSREQATNIAADLFGKSLTLLNHCKPSKPVKLDKDELEEIFVLDEDSPSGIRWSVTLSNRALKGKIAGSINNGYYIVNFKNKRTATSRIIMTMLGNDLTDKYVDHIDGNPLNNSINNLRIVCPSENSRNVKKRRNNTTGVVGVSLVYSGQGENYYYVAHWKENGKTNFKHFSIRNLGDDVAFKLAKEYRESQITRLNSIGHNYTERHGKDENE